MTGAEKALAAVLKTDEMRVTAVLDGLRALGFDLVKRKAPTARTTKAGLVLSDGCKVKIDPNVNPDATDPAHIADLESFHAEIHALQAARHAAFLARPAGGDGTIAVPANSAAFTSQFRPKGYGERAVGTQYNVQVERYLPDGTVIGRFTSAGVAVSA